MNRMRRLVLPIVLGVALAACGFEGDAGFGVTREPLALMIWSSGSLSSPMVDAVRRQPGVTAAVPVSSGMLDLRSVTGASRRLPPRAPRGVLPVSAAGVDWRGLDRSPRYAEVARALRAGQAVLSEDAAALRGMEAGDALTLAGRGRTARLHVGLVADAHHELSSEILVPAAVGRRLGLRARRALVVTLRNDELLDALPAVARRLREMPFRVRSLTDPAPEGDLQLLSMGEIKRLFGEFTFVEAAGRWVTVHPSWVRANIAEADVPGLGHVKCHRRMLPQLAGAMTELQSRGLIGLIQSYDGCWAPRVMATNSAVISRHAFGIAVDINARDNGLGREPKMDRRVVEVMDRWGFAWGGDFLQPDGMHFELVRVP